MSHFRDYFGYTPHKINETIVKQQIKKLKEKNPNIAPIIIEGRNLAKTWWGKAWNKNLQLYSDYPNRLARGRRYVRDGAVLDLQIGVGLVTALVSGSRRTPYKVEVRISRLSQEQLGKIVKLCNRRILDLEQLLTGNFPQELAKLFTMEGEGLFPTSHEITFYCSCPDQANMCKHVTAVLYGIGTRFDEDPTLFFKLRDVDFHLLMKRSIEEKMHDMLKNAGKPSKRILKDEDIPGLFGI